MLGPFCSTCSTRRLGIVVYGQFVLPEHFWRWKYVVIFKCLKTTFFTLVHNTSEGELYVVWIKTTCFHRKKKYNNQQGFVAKRNPLRPFQQGVACKWNGNTVIVVKSSKVLFDLSIISILSPSFFTTATFGRFDLQESTKRFEKIFRRWRSIRKRCTLGPAKNQNLKKKARMRS